MYVRKTPMPLHCGLYITREILNGKWKVNLIYAIAKGYKRPSEMQRVLPEATKRVLNLQLKELEQHGILSKQLFHEIPLRVEYSLTPLGETLVPVIDAMSHWGEQNREQLEVLITRDDPAMPILEVTSCSSS